MLAAALLTVVLSIVGVNITPPQANASVGTVTWPNVPLPWAMVYAHGNNALTIASEDCSYYYDYAGTTPSVITYKPDYSGNSAILKDTSGWKITACYYQRAVGSDGTTYVVEQNPSYGQRLVATRNGVTLWIRSFPTACGYSPGIFDPTLGYNGQLYVELHNACSPSLHQLAGVDTGTGAVLFRTNLPSNTSRIGYVANDIMPYDTGIAVANSENHIYYYSYAGVLDTSKTFTTPDVPMGAYVLAASTSATGRTYAITSKYVVTGDVGGDERHLYYKDPSNSIVTEIVLPTRSLLSNVFATPNNAALTTWTDSGGIKLGRFDSSGMLSYSQAVSADSTAGVVSGSGIRFGVDNLGNAVVVRTMQRNTPPYDQEIYVDSFDTSGIKTRLFDSEAGFGTSGADIFTTSTWSSQAIGDGKVYLTLCHQTGLSGSWPTTCSSSGNPQIVVIPAPGSFDYPRSALFATLNAQVQHVALGDSYSAGEGLPPFIAPTDNNGGNGCDRSQSNAYPELLASDLAFSLRAFVACSGATSDEVYTGKNSEPSQLDSLDANTDIVTITVGGNDVGFADFAAECVVGTCDAASSQYQNTLNEIDNYLQDNLELLFGRIRAAAPNAAIKVIGYPKVVPSSGGSCPTYISSGEQIAIDTVITGLNNKLYAAVQNSGVGFQFIDPTMTGSPFEGHSLCDGPNSYFFGLDIAEHRFSFHPNANGQVAYEELIANLI
jgi:lysophospholipase L1-like esterase